MHPASRELGPCAERRLKMVVVTSFLSTACIISIAASVAGLFKLKNKIVPLNFTSDVADIFSRSFFVLVLAASGLGCRTFFPDVVSKIVLGTSRNI
jgi:hypothetical protein